MDTLPAPQARSADDLYRKLTALAAVIVVAGTITALAVAPESAKAQDAPVEPPLADALSDYFMRQFGVGLGTVYWGDLHSHSYYSGDTVLQPLQTGNPATLTPADIFATARARGFSFAAVTDHAESPRGEQIPDEDDSANVWQSSRRMATAADDPLDEGDGVFIAFMGYEYTNPFPCNDLHPGDGVAECPGDCDRGDESCVGHGHKTLVFRDIAGAPSQRVSFLDPASWTPPPRECTGPRADRYCGFARYTDFAQNNQGLWNWLREHHYDKGPSGRADATTIIHSPGNHQHTDWDVTDPDLVRQVEIYSQWGNSEGPPPPACEIGDDLGVSLPSEAKNEESLLVRPQIGQRWLVEGQQAYALGFTAGSDDHTGRPGGHGNADGGVTGIIVPRAERTALYDGLLDRRTIAATYYASTGPLPVLFAIEAAGQQLFNGDIGRTPATGVMTVRVLADPRVEHIEVVLDGCTVRRLDGAAQQITLEGIDPALRHFVYVRARRATTAEDALDAEHPALTAYNQTWSSPIYLRSTPPARAPRHP